jgi:uncharacterized repeat protein (TIGR03803 family)
MNANSFGGKRAVKLTLAVAIGLILGTQVQAQTFTVLHNFTGGNDGGNPLSGFVMDEAGANLYGTASAGGTHGAGAVFRLNARGETILYNFTGGADGNSPVSSLIIDRSGNLYGTTYSGGANGAGTVYVVTPHKTEEVLYSFTGGSDGANPEARLAFDAEGHLYGTTTAGGAYGGGTVFEITAQNHETVLYSFGQSSDSATPVAGVTLDPAGNIYGTASAGGLYTYGTVFELTRSASGWTETILHNFQMQSDGGVPYGGLVFDKSGNLYGAATDGGQTGGGGGGTIFELTLGSGGWTFNTLYDLDGWGISGTFRDLLLDAAGNIYATTHCDGTNSAGTVYELTNSNGTWNYNQLYVFTGGDDGLYSFSNLVADKNGNLYGTTNQGGTNGSGVIFRVKP